MIEVKNLTKSFEKATVLENLNCKIEKGSIYGLVGANGAGKSTLLRIIMGIYKGEAGEVVVENEDPFDNEKVKSNMTFVPDDIYFYQGYTLDKMAKVYMSVYEKFDYEYFKKLTDIFHLSRTKKLNTFSKGMKRQSALILAISTKAEYLFFDETFDGLDPVIRNLVKKIICEAVSERKVTVILTSHNLRELEDICDHLGLLHKGGIFFESDINSLKTKMFKIQLALKEDFDERDLKELEIMSFKKKGSVATIIIKGEKEKTEEYLKTKEPIILDFIPLTLEEVFIYEMEVLGYEFNQL